jgi:hypothetical protein
MNFMEGLQAVVSLVSERGIIVYTVGFVEDTLTR